MAEVLAAGGRAPARPAARRTSTSSGLDYYAHNQWRYLDGHRPGHHGVARARLPRRPHRRVLGPLPASPAPLGETNIRGFAPDRASWLKYTLEQCEIGRRPGACPIDGYCWFPFVDSCDWDSLLVRSEGNIDPVGVYWLDERLDRRPSSMSAAYARGGPRAPGIRAPAYRFQPPVAGWLAGWMPQMAHWDWQDPPAQEVRPVRADREAGASAARWVIAE